MDRTLIKLILLCLIPIVLTGCGSSRKSVRSGGSGRITASHSGKPAGGASTPADGGSEFLTELLTKIADPMARDLIAEAGGWIGTQYLYGGASREGTDCSGLVMSVYRDVCGVKIPRTTRDQVRYCTQIARNSLLPGDLIFFGRGTSPDSVSHVGMYVGDGRMIHASSSRGVIVSPFDTGYWADRYTTAARVDAAPQAYAAARPRPSVPLQAAPLQATVTPSSHPASNPASSNSSTPADSPLHASSSSTAETAPPPSPVSIDLLDQIISVKLDSILSSSNPITL